jgi:hypothetical protein
VVVSVWEGACDRTILARELDRGFIQEELEEEHPVEVSTAAV